MFDNMGGKIKVLAKVVCWIGIIACVISGIVLMATDDSLIFVGILTAACGSLLSWVGSFVLYGFGQLVENSDEIVSQNNKLINHKVEKQDQNNRLINNSVDKQHPNIPPSNIPPSNSSNVEVPSNPTESQHKWRCDYCGKMISSSPCPYCGIGQRM